MQYDTVYDSENDVTYAVCPVCREGFVITDQFTFKLSSPLGQHILADHPRHLTIPGDHLDARIAWTELDGETQAWLEEEFPPSENDLRAHQQWWDDLQPYEQEWLLFK